MKSEIEFKWLVNLLTSPYVKKIIKCQGGCKKDFERVSGSSENNKEFHKWFEYLISIGAIEFYQDIKTRSKTVPTYVVNYKKLSKILFMNKMYPLVEKIAYKKYFG